MNLNLFYGPKENCRIGPCGIHYQNYLCWAMPLLFAFFYLWLWYPSCFCAFARISEVFIAKKDPIHDISLVTAIMFPLKIKKGYWVLECGHKDLWNTRKVEKILKGSLDSIPSPSPSMKIQIMVGKVCLRCKGKTLLGIVNKLLNAKSLLASPSNVLPYYLKQTFPPIIWIFTEGEGDGIESR